MNEQEQYHTVDLPFYRDYVEPHLPPEIVDFHAHVWHETNWKFDPWEENRNGAGYMVTDTTYSFEHLHNDARTMFPGKTYKAVCFGNPTPAVDRKKTNDYIWSGAKSSPTLFPLMIAGRDLQSPRELEQVLVNGGFYGYKVYLNWFGNNYGDVTIDDMIGPDEMKLADDLRLIVLLHVPGAERLADPVIQEGVRNLSRKYPHAAIVLAHCGRCYLPDRMSRAVDAVKDLANVYFDSSMVMDPTTIEILLEKVDSRRFLFGTDFPVPTMRGRRVYVADHWVDLVLEGNPPSDYRVQSNNMRATFMVYEIVLAIVRAAERLHVSEEEVKAIFHDNGMNLLKNVIVSGEYRHNRGRDCPD